jgi:transposase-like protein
MRELLKDRMKTSAMKLAVELLDQEVDEVCGPRYTREHPGEQRRGGSDAHGLIYLGGQRVRVRRPRVRAADGEHALESYRALQSRDVLSEAVQRRMLRGVSTRDYEDTITEIAGGLGLARSSVSRAFVRASQKDLDELNGRDLCQLLFPALFLDGIEFAGVSLLVGMGITEEGRKVLLGLVEGHTENADLCAMLLESISARGLRIPERVRVTIDGAKALASAVKRLWGDRAEIQRCQVHKVRNVLRHLPKGRHGEVRRQMHVAYNLEDAAEAERALRATVAWLRNISDAAASSLEEGLEETLTVVRLGLPAMLRRTLATTNPLESIFEGVRHRSRNVKRWKRSRHASRWAAAGLLFMEKRLHRIDGHRSIPVLIAALTKGKVDSMKEAG